MKSTDLICETVLHKVVKCDFRDLLVRNLVNELDYKGNEETSRYHSIKKNDADSYRIKVCKNSLCYEIRFSFVARDIKIVFGSSRISTKSYDVVHLNKSPSVRRWKL